MYAKLYNVRSKRRWFQFRLTTWFVFVAILAWAMLQWPWMTTTVESRSWMSPPVAQEPIRGQRQLVSDLDGITTVHKIRHLNPALLYPALALTTFIVWKGISLLRNRWTTQGDIADQWDNTGHF